MREINRSLTRIEAKDSYYSGNFGRSFRLTEAMAYEGDVKSEYTLGYMYFYGIGAPENKPLGIAWIKEAALRGYPPAVFALKKLVREPGYSEIEQKSIIAKNHPKDLSFQESKQQPIGQDISVKPAQGDDLAGLQEANVLALQGDASSQYMLGYMYYYGNGVEQNKSLGIHLIKQAAEKGHTSAVIALKKLEDFNQTVLAQSNNSSKDQFISLLQSEKIEKKQLSQENRMNFMSLLATPQLVKIDRKAQFMSLIKSDAPVKSKKSKPVDVTLNLLSFLEVKPTHASDMADDNFILQLGTFANPGNADSLLKKLSHKGYQAYSTKTKQNDKELSCVFIKSKNTSVYKMKENLEEQFNLKDVIVLNKVKQPTEKLILLAFL